MDPKTNIIMQLREIWLKLSKDKIEIAKKLELPNLSDEEKEDFRQATEGAAYGIIAETRARDP